MAFQSSGRAETETPASASLHCCCHLPATRRSFPPLSLSITKADSLLTPAPGVELPRSCNRKDNKGAVATLWQGMSPVQPATSHSQLTVVVVRFACQTNTYFLSFFNNSHMSGRSPGEGHGNPLLCPENPMDRVAWQATVSKRVAKSRIQLNRLSTWHAHRLVTFGVVKDPDWKSSPSLYAQRLWLTAKFGVSGTGLGRPSSDARLANTSLPPEEPSGPDRLGSLWKAPGSEAASLLSDHTVSCSHQLDSGWRGLPAPSWTSLPGPTHLSALPCAGIRSWPWLPLSPGWGPVKLGMAGPLWRGRGLHPHPQSLSSLRNHLHPVLRLQRSSKTYDDDDDDDGEHSLRPDLHLDRKK